MKPKNLSENLSISEALDIRKTLMEFDSYLYGEIWRQLKRKIDERFFALMFKISEDIENEP